MPSNLDLIGFGVDDISDAPLYPSEGGPWEDIDLFTGGMFDGDAEMPTHVVNFLVIHYNLTWR
jgi:hypothetical protein